MLDVVKVMDNTDVHFRDDEIWVLMISMSLIMTTLNVLQFSVRHRNDDDDGKAGDSDEYNDEYNDGYYDNYDYYSNDNY